MSNNVSDLATYVGGIVSNNNKLQAEIVKLKIYRGTVSGSSVVVQGITYTADFSCIDEIFIEGDRISCMLDSMSSKMVVIGR